MPRYKTYYGRKKRRWVKTGVIVLLLGGIAALCVFVLPGYISYSGDGLSFDFPFLTWISRSPSPPPFQQPPVIVEEPPSPVPTAPAPPPSPSPPPRRPEQVRALFVPLPLLGDAGELETIRIRAVEEGFNMLALEYKDIRGTIINASILTAALAVLEDPALTLTAVITAGADSTVPFGENSGWALKHTSGLNFKDNLDRRWLNLYLPEVREFIVQQVLDAYEAGFGRVLLTHVGFPYSSGASQIRYNEYDVTVGPVSAVNSLLAQLREAAGGRPLDAWIHERTAEEGLFETAGQDLAAFSEAFDLLFASLQDDNMFIDRDFIPVIPAGFPHELDFFMSFYSVPE